MKIIDINNFNEFIDAIESTWSLKPIFRGQSNNSWDLIPKIGRAYKYYPTIDKDNPQEIIYRREVAAFYDFQRRAIPHLKTTPPNDWQWLAIAQHYGFPTRLLDWTDNPLVAAYFACWDNYNSDSAVFVLDRDDVKPALKSSNPFMIKENRLFEPEHFSPRITAQSCVFTVHSQPHIEMDNESIQKWIIKKECSMSISRWLEKFGFNDYALFPDLDGLSKMLTHKFCLYDS